MQKINTDPTWVDGISFPDYPPLDQDTNTQILIIGAGITGITSAYLLAKKGKKVMLIDEKTPRESVTAYTTAFLTQELDTDLTELVAMFGEEKTALILSSHQKAIEKIADIVHSENIACEFVRCNAYFYANTADEWEALTKQSALANSLKLPWTKHTDQKLGFPNAGYLTLPNQAKFHPLRYLQSLVQKAQQQGVTIHWNTKAEKIDGTTIITNHGNIQANQCIIATYLPFNKPRETFAKKGVYTSYVIEAEIEKNRILEGIYWDMNNPYHYFRIDPQKACDRIIIGGDDHRHEIPFSSDNQYEKLTTYLETILKGSPYTMQRRWNGPIVENPAIALIGKTHKGQLLATGFSGNGMTYGTIAAMLFTDDLTNQKNPWADL